MFHIILLKKEDMFSAPILPWLPSPLLFLPAMPYVTVDPSRAIAVAMYLATSLSVSASTQPQSVSLSRAWLRSEDSGIQGGYKFCNVYRFCGVFEKVEFWPFSHWSES